MIEIIQRQPVLQCLRKICNSHLPVQGSILNLFQAVVPRDHGPMLPPQKPSHPYFLPPVERTIVGLPYPVGKLLQREFDLLHADWRFAFCTTQVRPIVALIICLIIVVGHLRHRRRNCNACDICFPRFCL